MFTGIVETLGAVRIRSKSRLVVQPRRSLGKVAEGESICVDGVCLTVEEALADRISFRLLPETIRVTTLGRLKEGGQVNLERALKAGSRLGGHLLLGHVDGRGRVRRCYRRGSAVTLELEAPHALAQFLVPKGPIAVDGVSLTLDFPVPSAGTSPGADLKALFRVHLIRQTLANTTLGRKKPEDGVNLEVDPIAKYLRCML